MLLITGFEPFGGEPINPAWEAVQRVGDTVGGAALRKALLPTAFLAAEAKLEALLSELRPEGVLCVGQAGGRSVLTVEQIAVNLRRASIPDNDGYQPADEPVYPGGPDGLLAAWDVPGAVKAIKMAGVPAAISYSAGTFVCNDLLYTLLRLIRTKYPTMQGGFLHLPYLPEQAARRPSPTPSMALDEMVRGLAAAITFLATQV